jgi:hypothetical protein
MSVSFFFCLLPLLATYLVFFKALYLEVPTTMLARMKSDVEGLC